MKLVKNKGRRLSRSLAMWCVYLSGLLQLAPSIVPYFDGWLPRWASVAFLVLSPIAYLIHQPNLKGRDNAE